MAPSWLAVPFVIARRPISTCAKMRPLNVRSSSPLARASRFLLNPTDKGSTPVSEVATEARLGVPDLCLQSIKHRRVLSHKACHALRKRHLRSLRTSGIV
jgi:hypothetical protein